MNCPYCNNEMGKGLVKGDGRKPFRWIENEEKIGLMDRMAVALDEKYIIAKSRPFHKTTIEGYKCKLCNKIIIDLE
ncbi:PF20097 family protein [Clostridium gasigenes]|uniref:PF20097 family protein n=1 Tax=Clostridium gasigenes TaxID=94869 RepID=UPI001C0B4BE6|nr:PF20097 family protein [Clostridium gasigenes]MBU3104557.1 hypothetical protein [Clostridium gasigenes]